MPVQRWRLTFARTPDAPDLTQREQLASWEVAIAAAGLRSDALEAPRLMLALPGQTGLTADAEVADLFLPERRTSADVRDRLESAMPPGTRLVRLHDVWLGEAALPGLVVAADYRVEVGPDEARDALADAVGRFLAAADVPRTKLRGDRAIEGNLRPYVLDLHQMGAGALWMRLRVDPTAGSARPEEVVTALGALAGRRFDVGRRHRERIWLKGDAMTAPNLPYG
jgi:radical SAM-linked protein